MAQRRMFSKAITNSSRFLKMPATSRLLYYDLGMNADDDGYAEHYMVMQMTGASQQDLGVLEINGLVKIFDENVLVIKDWTENNYIPKDRYKPSKYAEIYTLDTKCIQLVDKLDTQVRLGKDRLGKDKDIYQEKKNPYFQKPAIEEIIAYCKTRKNNIDAQHFYDYYEARNWMLNKVKMKDWKACVRTWEQNNKQIHYKGKQMTDKEILQAGGRLKNTPEEEDRIRKEFYSKFEENENDTNM